MQVIDNRNRVDVIDRCCNRILGEERVSGIGAQSRIGARTESVGRIDRRPRVQRTGQRTRQV